MRTVFKYKRDKYGNPFTITGLFSQIAEFVAETGKEPTIIQLSPHEYYFLRYLVVTLPNVELTPEELFGMPIHLIHEKQEGSFSI